MINRNTLIVLVFAASFGLVIHWFSSTEPRSSNPPHEISAPSILDESTDDGPDIGASLDTTTPAGLIALGTVSEIDSSSVPSFAIPSDSATHVPTLVYQAENGSVNAALELYLLTTNCAPRRLVPTSEQALEEHVRRISDTRMDQWGNVIDDQDRAIKEVRRLYAFCGFLAEHSIPGYTHWIRTAAELGHHVAMAHFFSAQYSALIHSNGLEELPQNELSALKEEARHYLERARDEGSVEAFMTIGLSSIGLINGPYANDAARGYAHLRAAAHMQRALVAQRELNGFYAQRGEGQRNLDVARVDSLERYARRAELEAASYELQSAGAQIIELLQRCCDRQTLNHSEG